MDFRVVAGENIATRGTSGQLNGGKLDRTVNANPQAQTYNSSQLTNGVVNIGLGLLGVFASGAVIVGTEGMAAPIAWILFTTSLSSVTIGIAQVVDAFANPSMPTRALQNSDNLPGLVAYGLDSPYAWSINSGFNLGSSLLGGAPLAQIRTYSSSTSLFQRTAALVELGDFGLAGYDFAMSLGHHMRNVPQRSNAVRVGHGVYINAYP
ncbi:MAG TPA: hypothetical protein VK147_12200 [Candidatus Didemnitutus sp.]|nr:hypothetical protein [Candidatus Didemnitutus sp.]